MSQAPLQIRFAVTLGSLLMASSVVQADTGSLNFSRDIRPILSDKCFQCHGPDESKKESGLQLNLRDSAFAPAASGLRAVVPNQPEASELIKRIVSKDSDTVMPPPGSTKSLSASEIELLRRWVAEGATYAGHWAFIPPQRPDVPASVLADAEGWSDNPIDRFLQTGLQVAGLKPNPSASREALVRRVALDLTGLPPTPAQVDKYLADNSPQAYERMVDGLFASPHYGERMALNWLDFARYADSNGYQSDGSRDIWGWRDWVINAYNQNVPFDQFTIEQLAGDMLPNASAQQIIATGFNRNHRLNGEGGRIVDEWFVETVIDRVETTGLTWLGLTFNCCRCHDHKYDPISQKEFYQMFAFFNSVDEQGVLAPVGGNAENTPPLWTMKTETHAVEIAKREAEIASLEQELKALKSKLPELAVAWATKKRGEQVTNVSAWQTIEPSKVTSVGGATLARQEDGSYLASGNNPANDIYEVTLPVSGGSLSGVLLEVLPDVSLPNQSLGRGSNGNFVMTDFSVEFLGDASSKLPAMKLVRAEADFAQQGWPAANVLANTPQATPPLQGWAIEGNNPERRLPRKIMFLAEQPAKIPEGSSVVVRFGNRSQFADHNVGRFRLSITGVAPEQVTLGSSGVPVNVLAAIGKLEAEWSDSERQAIENYFLSDVPSPIRETDAKIQANRKALAETMEALPTTMVMKEGKTRDAFVLLRGEYDKPGVKVDRAVPAVLPPLPDSAPVDRLGLAQWIVARNNPLTARVWVNREWERFFGMGIVKTTENFGSQAEYPVNAALLDWLAVEFMEPTLLPAVGGQAARSWDMKALQKLILMSAAYRQSTQVTPEKLERDPDNRLSARGPRFRLPGEVVRDSALAVSGALVETIGGPSVRPYMPAGVWDETSKYGNLRNYQHDKNEGLYRRSMYTIWKRTAAPPTMLLFDAPNREVCTVKRSRTNTPLQALSLLNEVTFVEAARQLAGRMLSEGGQTAKQRLAYGFRLALARNPTDAEMQVLLSGLEADRQRFVEGPTDANVLLAFGDAKPVADIPAIEMAAYTLTANVILNLDEFVTRE
jgi:hypothetical protein